MTERDLLRDHAAHRRTDDVRSVDVVGVEHRDRVVGHVLDRVLGLAERIVDRAAGVAVVVANDVPTGAGQPLAEARRATCSIDALAPMMRRIGVSLGSPNASVQMSTPSDLIIRSVIAGA